MSLFWLITDINEFSEIPPPNIKIKEIKIKKNLWPSRLYWPPAPPRLLGT